MGNKLHTLIGVESAHISKLSGNVHKLSIRVYELWIQIRVCSENHLRPGWKS